MNVSTSYLFDRAVQQFGTRQQALADVQAQLASAKRVVRPSSDPASASVMDRLKSIIDRQERHAQAVVAVQNRLGLEESALTSVVDVLMRMKDLTLQAANGTMDLRSRMVARVELDGLREQLLSLANTRDVDGSYIFSGARVGEKAFDYLNPDAAPEDRVVVYQGDRTSNQVAVGDHRQLVMNRPGPEVFESLSRVTVDAPATETSVGFFEALSQLSGAFKGRDVDVRVTITGTESDRRLRVEDALTGKLLEEDVPYAGGGQLSWGGVTVELGQEPKVGDHFRLDGQRAMQQGIEDLDKMIYGVSLVITRVGTDLSVADLQTQVLEETQLQLKSVLSKVEDLDYAEAVTRMQKELLSLEAAQSSFAKISQLSLFDYLR